MSYPRRDPYGPPRSTRVGMPGRPGVTRPGRQAAASGPVRPRPGPDHDDRPGGMEPLPELPPARPRGHYRGKRRDENPWVSYGLIVAVPLVLVLLIVGFSALPPYTQNSRAQSQPATGTTATGTNQGAAPTTGATGATTANAYEAEDAAHNALGPTTKLRAVAGASGGQVVTNIGHGTPAGDVRFNAVTAAAAGKYTLSVYYLLGDTKAHRLALWVNGKGPTILSFPPSGGANQIATYRTTITLAAGTNTIRFSNATTAYGPDLDRIALQQAQ